MPRYLIIFLLICPIIQVNAQEIAITFDDAPTGDGPFFEGSVRTEKILTQLRTHQVETAAFFVLTRNVTKETKGRLQQYSSAGHILANHSHTHTHIHRLGPEGYIDDIKTADSVLSQYSSYHRWFRFPFLDEGRTTASRDSIRFALQQLGLTNGYVTVDNYDWYLNHLLARAVEQKQKVNMDVLRDIYVDHIYQSILFYDRVARTHLGRSPRHVLLLHENDLAALFLGDLLDHLKKNGWKIITPHESYQDPIASHIPDVLFNGQGRVAAIARERGVPARELVQESEDEVYLDELVKRRNAFE